MNIDKEISCLKDYLDDKNFDWSSKKLELQTTLASNNYKSERNYIISFIKNHFGSNKDLNILDFGCGSGIYVIILLLMGYKNVRGVDVVKKFDDRVIENLNFSKETFDLVNGKLPYPDKTFDFINSTQVLEHVDDLNNYYKEAARVLKDGGICFFSFPHRLQIYDTHSETFIIHWLPKFLRKVLYDVFTRQGGKYINNYLFLHTLWHHKKVAKKYFFKFKNINTKRLIIFDSKNYKGKLTFRIYAHKLMNLKILGKIFIYFFSFFSSADIVLKK